MTETELLQQIDYLRSRVSEHQTTVAELQQRLIVLRTPPEIPSGATPTQIADLFEAVAGRDDEIVGVEAALTELQRRTESLRAQLQHCQCQLTLQQEQESCNRLRQDVLSAIQI